MTDISFASDTIGYIFAYVFCYFLHILVLFEKNFKEPNGLLCADSPPLRNYTLSHDIIGPIETADITVKTPIRYIAIISKYRPISSVD